MSIEFGKISSTYVCIDVSEMIVYSSGKKLNLPKATVIVTDKNVIRADR